MDFRTKPFAVWSWLKPQHQDSLSGWTKTTMHVACKSHLQLELPCNRLLNEILEVAWERLKKVRAVYCGIKGAVGSWKSCSSAFHSADSQYLVWLLAQSELQSR